MKNKFFPSDRINHMIAAQTVAAQMELKKIYMHDPPRAPGLTR